MATITFDCEITDTIGGEANYSWVIREQIQLSANASRLSVMRAGKRALGLSGIRCKVTDYGEMFELRPYGTETVAFIVPQY